MSDGQDIIFSSDFESGANGWSSQRVRDTYNADTYLGGFGRTNTTKADIQRTFNIPADARSVEITFDFLEIDRWNGEHFYVYVNNQQIDLGRFYLDNRHGQEADRENSNASGNISWTVSDTNTLIQEGVGNRRYIDEKHTVTIAIKDPEPILVLGFGSSLNQVDWKESWGVDNLTIVSRTEESTLPSEPDTSAPSTTVSSELFYSDFESGVNGWSKQKLKQTHLGDTYLRGFKDKYTQKVFDVPAETSQLTITFDFLEIDHWDGEHFYVHINGQRIDLGKFYNNTEYSMTADAVTSGTNGNISWAVSDTDTFIKGRVQNRRWDDEKHTVTITIDNPSTQLVLGFSASLDERKRNESWGIDNLKIIRHEEVDNSEVPNQAPMPLADQATTVYDQAVTVDVISNDTDPDGHSLVVTAVNDQALTAGGSAMNIDGVLVSLNAAGELVFDGSSAYSGLVFGQSVTKTYTYTISDGNGGESTANVEVTFKGETDTIAKVDAQLTDATITLQAQANEWNDGSGASSDAYDIQLSNAGSLNGVYVHAYSLDFFTPITGVPYGDDITDAYQAGATITIADDDFLSIDQQYLLSRNNAHIDYDGDGDGDGLHGGVNGKSALENLDLINWIINQDFENTDNGDGLSQNFTGAEVQTAIWALTNGARFEGDGFTHGILSPYFQNTFGTVENANEIVQAALLSGEGFEAGSNDLVGVYVSPDFSDPNFTQPFIVGINLYETYSA